MLNKSGLTSFYLLLTLAACNKDNEEQPTEFIPGKLPAIYWISDGTTTAHIVKGTPSDDSTRHITELYAPAPEHAMALFALNASNKDLVWVEVDAGANVLLTSQIYKGDTTGTAPVRIADVPAAVHSLAVNPANSKVYWTQRDEATATDKMYSCDAGGSNVTRLLSDDTLHTVSHITIDTVSNTLFFVETYTVADTAGTYSRVSRASLDGSGKRVILYDKRNFPVTPLPFDWFTGLAVNDNFIYLSTQPGISGNISYIFKGSVQGAAVMSLTRFVQSTPAAGENILDNPVALAVDTKRQYLYWMNRGSNSNGLSGSIYRTTFTVPAATDLVFDNINVTGANYAALATGW